MKKHIMIAILGLSTALNMHAGESYYSQLRNWFSNTGERARQAVTPYTARAYEYAEPYVPSRAVPYIPGATGVIGRRHLTNLGQNIGQAASTAGGQQFIGGVGQAARMQGAQNLGQTVGRAAAMRGGSNLGRGIGQAASTAGAQQFIGGVGQAARMQGGSNFAYGIGQAASTAGTQQFLGGIGEAARYAQTPTGRAYGLWNRLPSAAQLSAGLASARQTLGQYAGQAKEYLSPYATQALNSNLVQTTAHYLSQIGAGAAHLTPPQAMALLQKHAPNIADRLNRMDVTTRNQYLGAAIAAIPTLGALYAGYKYYTRQPQGNTFLGSE